MSIIQAFPAGADGGTSDYTDLENKPQIAGVTLSGNKTLSELGIQPAEAGKGLSTEDYTTAEKTKLDNIDLSNYVPNSEVGSAGGVAELDANGKVPVSQMPNGFDNIDNGTAGNVTSTVNGYTAESFTRTGESSPVTPADDTLYVDITLNIAFRWTGTQYISVGGGGVALGETSSTAYRGDRGKIAYDDSQANKSAIGTLSNLNTTEKTNLVGAINEVKSTATSKEDKFRYTIMPEASADYVGKIVDYIGSTTATYTKNTSYECKAQGTSPETYAWEEVSNVKELTQAEYNTLSTNDRNNGTVYLISDKRTILCRGVNYSSERQVIDVEEPEVTIGTYTYDGTAQGPTIVSRDTEHTTVTNATATDAGTYTMTIALNNAGTMMWPDGTTLDRTYTYTIDKAEQTVTIDKDYVELNDNTSSATVTATIVGDGTLVAESLDTDIATVSVSNNVITINRGTKGTTTISVKVAGTNNYNESTSVSITVKIVTLMVVSWANGTDEEIVNLIAAADRGEIDLYEDAGWRVGDERNVTIPQMSNGNYALGPTVIYAQTITLVLLDRGAVYKTSSGDKSINFVVGVKSRLTNDSNNEFVFNYNGNAVWTNSKLRGWLNDIFYNNIPSSIRSIFKQVKVPICTDPGSMTSDPTLSSTDDYFFLCSSAEIFKGDVTYGSGSPEGQQTALATIEEFALTTRFDYYADTTKRNLGYQYFTRSMYWGSLDKKGVWVSNKGTPIDIYASARGALLPIACI